METCLELGYFHYIIGGITAYSLGRFDDFENGAGWGFYGNSFPFNKENFANHIFRKEILGILKQLGREG